MDIRKIVVPVDFSAFSDAALAYALFVAENTGARVEVLHVIAPPPYVPLDLMLWTGLDERTLEELEERLERLVDDAKGEREVATTTRIENGVPHDVILSAAEEADLVVMGTHGRTGLAHVVLGSVAERTLRLAKCPVVVVPR